MSAPLHVLVYGSTPLGVCDFYRTWMYEPYLRELGVELRSWIAREPPRRPAHPGGLAWADRAAIEWADVVVFRRAEQTHHLCFDCGFASLSRRAALDHARGTGHQVQWAANEFLRPLWTALETDPRLLRGRALVYETDDDLARLPAWNGNRRILAPERGLIEAMLRRADLVTVSTPLLAERVRAHSPRIRVIRNAVEPAWYEVSAAPDLPGQPRVLHYGNLSRLTYYEVCRAAVDEAKRRQPELRRVWLGAPDDPDHRAPLMGLVDEVRPYVVGVPAFARALVEARPDIGLAPLLGDDFDRAKSELHWLEYSLAGAVTVASRVSPSGPYGPIRNGLDGFLVKGKSEWLEVLLRLARSPGLRAEVAGRARERVRREYDARQRAVEWADAFRWAAEHAEIGRLARPLVVDPTAVAAVRRSAAASLAHRRRVRRRQAATVARLARLRERRPTLFRPGREQRLVSVVLPVVGTGDEAADRQLVDLCEQSIDSVLSGLHRELELLIVDPAGRPLPTADARVRRIPTPPSADSFRAAQTPPTDGVLAVEAAEEVVEAAKARALNRGLAAARGAWIATLEPGVVVSAEHLALLLEVALDGDLEAVYGWLLESGDRRSGSWPPDPEDIPSGSELVCAGYSFLRFDPRAPLLGRSIVAERWRRLLDLGLQVANIEAVVARRGGETPDPGAPCAIATGRT